ncbi:Lysine decarboxylase family protein isoform 1 [Hibiscus syriacus]|uniref:Lysine decarboxylase family protein isoform 1 n=1 Tax=Hibiscus syriacus TaxID=106335 RepID=A0A6A2YMQ6_HIBSY|nr:Lysine decarboxylase family protein isoform 1 [Hibiscus syriacus]
MSINGFLVSKTTLFLVGFITFVTLPAEAAVRKYQFDIRVKNVSRLCHAKPIVTANGRFPGPTIYAQEGDRVIVNVTNHAKYNMSIHWHGLNFEAISKRLGGWTGLHNAVSDSDWE